MADTARIFQLGFAVSFVYIYIYMYICTINHVQYEQAELRVLVRLTMRVERKRMEEKKGGRQPLKKKLILIKKTSLG